MSTNGHILVNDWHYGSRRYRSLVIVGDWQPEETLAMVVDLCLLLAPLQVFVHLTDI